jgi:hypothetical protein
MTRPSFKRTSEQKYVHLHVHIQYGPLGKSEQLKKYIYRLRKIKIIYKIEFTLSMIAGSRFFKISTLDTLRIFNKTRSCLMENEVKKARRTVHSNYSAIDQLSLVNH